jgi:hypothetical protein
MLYYKAYYTILYYTILYYTILLLFYTITITITILYYTTLYIVYYENFHDLIGLLESMVCLTDVQNHINIQNVFEKTFFSYKHQLLLSCFTNLFIT